MNSEVNYNIAIQVVNDTLSMFGVNARLKSETTLSDNFKVSDSVLALVAIIGDIKINIIYSMDIKTAESIVAIMMGAPEYKMDTIGRSAIAELSNMISGGICTALSDEYPGIEITTPTVLTGESVSCTIHSVESKQMIFDTDFGEFVVNFAPES